MKLSELEVNKEYAVVPSWTYNSRSARDINNVRENDVMKAELISKDKYEYEPSYRKSSPTEFTPAKDGNRSVGVLVKATDQSGNDVYWTTRLADIVAVYSDLTPKWEAEKLKQDEQEREMNEKRAKVDEHKKNVYAEVERSRNSVVATTKELLGDKAEVNVDTTGYDFNMRGMVSISLGEFEKLIEMAYAGKENY
jgi:hypothetical protein